MGDSTRPEKIIAQAAHWNFEGDCSLLTWMQELSQNLEQRATATNDALHQLSINVNRTATALDNTANSLTALQYTQFVECRCHDDDETIGKATDVVPVEVVNSPGDKAKTTTEVMATFLRNNLEMLHKTHEKYALDFDDSDEDEGATASNYIYQPRNPYNEALLPHIYGSKLWKEHWHVGLCDGTNEYSGDEASDAFSDSTSPTATDNESYESNTANLSEWASSNSIPVEHKHPAQMTAAHISTTHLPQEQRMPILQRMPSNDDSDTYSTTSRSTPTKNPQQQAGVPRDHDLFASLRHESPATSTSVSSSPHKYTAPPPKTTLLPPAIHSQRGSAQTLPPLIDATPPADIFVGTRAVQQPAYNRGNEAPQKQAVVVQPKQKPVNLFDDDDFNSFMTEAVGDKPQTGGVQQVQIPIPAARKLPKKSEVSAPKTIDLFAENSNNKAPAANLTSSSPNEVQRQAVNLFDSPEGSPPSDALFSNPTVATNKKDSNANVLPAVVKPSITAKSLFDDDEDDDDFLNVFGSKKLSLPSQRGSGKTLLFDNDNEEEVIPPTKQTPREISNLFDDTPPADIEVTTSTAATKLAESNERVKDNSKHSATQKHANTLPKVDLFDDNQNVSASKVSAISVKPIEVQEKPLEPSSVKSTNKLFSADLFADDESSDLADLLRQQTTTNQTSPKSTIPSETVTKNVASKALPSKEVIIQQRKPLFEDEEFDQDDGDLFGKSLIKDKSTNATNDLNTNTNKRELPKTSVPSENLQGAMKPIAGAFKSTTLFADDFEKDDDLFGRLNLESDMHDEKIAVQNTTTDIRVLTETEIKEKSGLEKNLPKPLFEPATKSGSKELLPNAAMNTEKIANAAKDTVAAPATKDTLMNKEFFVDKEMASNAQQDHNYATKTTNKLPMDSPVGVDNTKCTTDEIAAEHIASKSAADKNKSDFPATNFVLPEKDMPSGVLSVSDTTYIPTTSSSIPSANIAVQSTTPKMESDVATSSSYKYSGIFLDEPPDDDDFFTTLSSGSKQMSVSKLTLDLENDFYEPALPTAPNTAKATTTTNTQNDGNNNKNEPAISDYGGLRLFSEIPPDDDGDDISFAATGKNSTEIAATNQRLHNVFYDDFTETLEAVQQMRENKIGAHVLFPDDEVELPPPAPPIDTEGKQFDIVEKMAQEKCTIKNKEFTGPKEIAEKQMIVSSLEPSKDETDRVAEKPRSSTGKLQMPNIKINVQALLPGGGRPNFKNSANLAESAKLLDDPEIATALAKEPTTAHLPSSTSSTSTNENLLQSVCKTRVRVPAGRRPSTRRARQENYRKSVIEEQEAHEQTVAGSAVEVMKASSFKQQAPKKYSNKMEVEKGAVNAAETHSQAKHAFSSSSAGLSAKKINLFMEDDVDDGEDNGFLFPTAHSAHNSASNVPKQIVDVNIKAHAPTEQPHPVSGTTTTTTTTQILSSFSKDFIDEKDDEADELFKSIRAAPINSSITTTKPTPNIITAAMSNTKTAVTKATTTTTKSLFGTPSSGESDDDLFKSSKTTTAKTAKPMSQTTTTTAATITASAHGFSAQTKATTATNNNNKLDSIFGSDDEDDDFLSNLKTIKKTTTKSMPTSVGGGGAAGSKSGGGGGLFSDIESDEDIFGGKSKPKQAGATKRQTTNAPKSHLPPTKSIQKSTATATKPASNEPTTLADNPLADLLNP